MNLARPDNFDFSDAPGVRSQFASAGANRIHYQTAGDGEQVLVFIHGWACHLGFWQEQVAALAKRARLVFIDLPGHGRSDRPQTACTLDVFAAAVAAVLRDANVERATFIGHSMGGAVICRLHHRAPEKFTGLVSVDGLLRRPAGSIAEVRALIRPFASSLYRDHARAFIRTFFPVPGTEALREEVTAAMLNTPQNVMLGGMLAMFGPDQPDWMLDSVEVPVVAINSKSPWWNDGYESYVRHLSPQSDYIQMEGAGHFLMLEQPSIFNDLLAERLEKHGLIGR